PDGFIPLAEETGLIGPLTRWVLGAALWQAHSWQARGKSLRVAVNLSAHDVQDLTLPARIADLLAETGVSADQLTLELTETALMVDVDRAMQVLQDLRDLGVQVAIDDFGTGYSSLSYLTSLPAHELKIDGRFIRDLSQGSRAAAVVRSTIDMAHSLGLTVVAEGVEDRDVLELLQTLGCDRAQGYALGR